MHQVIYVVPCTKCACMIRDSSIQLYVYRNVEHRSNINMILLILLQWVWCCAYPFSECKQNKKRQETQDPIAATSQTHVYIYGRRGRSDGRDAERQTEGRTERELEGRHTGRDLDTQASRQADRHYIARTKSCWWQASYNTIRYGRGTQKPQVGRGTQKPQVTST